MYGLDSSYLIKSQLNSLDFVINRLFVKLFITNNVNDCQCCFGSEAPSEFWVKRVMYLFCRATIRGE